MVFRQAMKGVIFENLSTTTKIKSMARCVRGKPNTKSILICNHEWSIIVHNFNDWKKQIASFSIFLFLLLPVDVCVMMR
jgi:hypothetical protein